jgi:hypothetical protein
VASSDTFFIATAHPEAGADASHRGGNPGFVEVSGDGTTLLWPDYSGNAMFNTLGNLVADPSAGLLFLDGKRGGALQITGAAEILWDGPDVRRLPGAERAVRFRVAEVSRPRPARCRCAPGCSNTRGSIRHDPRRTWQDRNRGHEPLDAAVRRTGARGGRRGRGGRRVRGDDRR